MAPVIDSHIHFWQLARGDYAALTPDMPVLLRDHLPDDLAPHLAACGVERIVVVQAAETVAETRFTLGLAQRHAMIAGVVGWVELASPEVAATLDALRADPRFKGVRPVRADNVSIAWMADTALDRGLRALAARGLSLDILVQNPDELPVAIALAERHGDLAIVLDHCAKPRIARGEREPWAGNLRRLAALPNVACKFSGLLNQAAPGARAEALRPYAEHVIDCFGPSRLLWGSDWPPLRLAAEYAVWWEVAAELLAGLSAAERAQVMGLTAQRVYRL
jgi:L-fuconolactonase